MTNIDWNKPVQTKGGRKVRILCADGPDSDFPVVGFAGADGIVSYWTKSGKTCEGFSSLNDLINVPEKHELWVNVYRNTSTRKVARVAFGTRPEADAGDTIIGSEWSRIACLHREFQEGEGLS